MRLTRVNTEAHTGLVSITKAEVSHETANRPAASRLRHLPTSEHVPGQLDVRRARLALHHGVMLARQVPT